MITPHDAANTIKIRSYVAADFEDMVLTINGAAEAYRGVIPADCWHDPYMPAEDLRSEMADGVEFSVSLTQNRVVGLMGVQRRQNVDLIRHAYVSPASQGLGVGSALLDHLCDGAVRPILVGTWRAAEWAIRFYSRHGFASVDNDDISALLRTYWNVPERQIATSVVLARPALSRAEAGRLLSEVGAVPKPSEPSPGL
jgi:GNAT superfamily N-acetyltransferase